MPSWEGETATVAAWHSGLQPIGVGCISNRMLPTRYLLREREHDRVGESGRDAAFAFGQYFPASRFAERQQQLLVVQRAQPRNIVSG